jgi:hypothetical protein
VLGRRTRALRSRAAQRAPPPTPHRAPHAHLMTQAIVCSQVPSGAVRCNHVQSCAIRAASSSSCALHVSTAASKASRSRSEDGLDSIARRSTCGEGVAAPW